MFISPVIKSMSFHVSANDSPILIKVESDLDSEIQKNTSTPTNDNLKDSSSVATEKESVNYQEDVKKFLKKMYNYDNKTDRVVKLEDSVTDSFKNYLSAIQGTSNLEYQSVLQNYDIYKIDEVNETVVVRVKSMFKVSEQNQTVMDTLLTFKFKDRKVDKQSIEAIQSQNQMKQW
ncbi:hypothetical protein [Isobaculum melis]|nr:hypothetical protein [Isobaculum melis]